MNDKCRLVPALTRRNPIALLDRLTPAVDLFKQNNSSLEFMKYVSNSNIFLAPIDKNDIFLFNRAYLLRNIFKCYYCFSLFVDFFKTRKFIDIGSGGGAFSVAIDAIIKDSSAFYFLCDKNIDQIDYSKSLISSIYPDGVFYFHNSNIFDILHLFPDCIRVSSYCLSDIYSENKYFSLLDFLGPGAIILDHTISIQRLCCECDTYNVPYHIYNHYVHIPDLFIPFVQQKIVSISFGVFGHE